MDRQGIRADGKNRTSAAAKALNRSRKSGFIVQLAAQRPQLLTELPQLKHAVGRSMCAQNSRSCRAASAAEPKRRTVMRSSGSCRRESENRDVSTGRGRYASPREEHARRGCCR